MGHLYIQEKNKKNYKTVERYTNKTSIQNSEHSTKHSRTSPMNRQIQQKWHLPNRIPIMCTKRCKANKQNIPY